MALVGEQGSVGSIGDATLANVKPVANWADGALNSAYKDLYFARKKGSKEAIERALTRLAKLRQRAGLEG